jgi:hypothetical protein
VGTFGWLPTKGLVCGSGVLLYPYLYKGHGVKDFGVFEGLTVGVDQPQRGFPLELGVLKNPRSAPRSANGNLGVGSNPEICAI